MHPPALHTARRSRRCSPVLNRPAASGLTSMVSALSRARIRRQLMMCWIWLSAMNTTEVWPRPVFGPSTMKKFGKPGTVMPW